MELAEGKRGHGATRWTLLDPYKEEKRATWILFSPLMPPLPLLSLSLSRLLFENWFFYCHAVILHVFLFQIIYMTLCLYYNYRSFYFILLYFILFCFIFTIFKFLFTLCIDLLFNFYSLNSLGTFNSLNFCYTSVFLCAPEEILSQVALIL